MSLQSLLLDSKEEWDYYRRFVLENPWIPKRRDPVTGLMGPSLKQKEFLCANELEVFFGGAAAGGKTEGLLTAFAMFVESPGYNGVLFRQSLQDHKKPKGLIPRCLEWWDGLVVDGRKARWNGVDYTWTFPSGATLYFGYMDSEDDKFRYKSSEFDFIGWDELTEFTESQYTYLMSRLRRGAGSWIPPRVRSASNPDGIGHDWVKHRFIKGPADDATWKPLGRFIPAFLGDNNFVDRKGYETSLGMLDYVTRMQLMFGDWDISVAGNKFKYVWFVNDNPDLGMVRSQIVKASPEGLRQVRFWDLAGSEVKKGNDPDWTAGVRMGRSTDGRVYVTDMQHFRESSLETERRVRATAEADGLGVIQYAYQDPAQAGKSQISYYARQVLAGLPFVGVPITGDKVLMANPLSALCEMGNLYLVEAGWNNDFINELCQFPVGSHDDIVDAASGALSKLQGPSGPIRVASGRRLK